MKNSKWIFHFIFTGILFSLIISNQFSQNKTGGTLSGLVFGDYYYKMSGDSSGAIGDYAPLKKTSQAFSFRRIYLTYNHVINEKFSAQFQLESSDKILTSTRLGVFVKTAFLEWTNIFKGSNLQIGLIPTYSFAISEKMWNYRAVEKTISDFRGLAIPSDMGAGLRGNFDNAGNYGYTVTIGNGNAQKPEINKFKKYYASLFAKPVKGLTLEVYSDFEPFDDLMADVKRNKMTMKGFAGYQAERFGAGAELVRQTQKNFGGKDADIIPLGISFYAWGNILKGNAKTSSNMLNAFARFDMYNPNTKNDTLGYKENFFTAGLDFMPFKDVHFMPNVWFNSYTDKSSANVKRDADVVVRMTFFYVYK
jgi:hypothetical protein